MEKSIKLMSQGSSKERIAAKAAIKAETAKDPNKVKSGPPILAAKTPSEVSSISALHSEKEPQ
jgi:hypothetical protein